MTEIVREDIEGAMAGRTPEDGSPEHDADGMTLGDWMSPPRKAAPDSAALLAGALEDIALRLQRHEDRVAGALDALDRRLERIEERDGGADEGGVQGAVAALTERLGAIGERVEDLSDSVAAISGDIEDTRRGLERSHEETARLTERVEAQDTAGPAEGFDEIKAAIRELAGQIKTGRAETRKIGGAAEKAVRELGRRGQEAALAQQDATGKVARAISVMAARVETIERADADRTKRLEKVEEAIGSAENALESLSPDGVAPHVARVEREITAFNQSVANQGAARADVFDRIAASAESAYERKRKARSDLGDQAAELRQRARGEKKEPAPAAPEPAKPQTQTERAASTPPADTVPPAAAAPDDRETGAPETGTGAAASASGPEAEDSAGALTVRPGSTAQANRRGRKQREQSFEDAFEGDPDETEEPPSIASIRQRFRGGEEDEEDEGLDLVAAFDEQKKGSGAQRDGLMGRVMGLFQRKKKTPDPEAPDTDEDDFDSVDFDDEDGEDDPYAVFDEPAPTRREGRKGAGKAAKKKSVPADDPFDDAEDYDQDWAEEAGRGRPGGLRIALLVLLILAALAVGYLLTQGAAPGL